FDLGQNGDAMGAKTVDSNQWRVADGLGIICENMTHGASPCGVGLNQPMPDTRGRQSVELPPGPSVPLNMNKTLRISMVTVAVLALLLIILHLMLPHLVRNLLNDKLADMGEYQGHIEDVDMTWWNGAYRINALVITKTEGEKIGRAHV